MLLAVQARESTAELSADEICTLTLASYEADAKAYQQATAHRAREADHALFFRYLALAFPTTAAYDLLDVGCGPGRDLARFRALGHRAVGLDGCPSFVAMARAASAGLVLHQDLRRLRLVPSSFDGIFASASLFHLPQTALPTTLESLARALRPRGVLFTLNPRGADRTGFSGERYCCFLRFSTWRTLLGRAGFRLLDHEYRPLNQPRRRQQWIAAAWQRCVT
jgi:SAM-dependent methyltransferase